ncbi:MAG TPA: TetR/AcrR family transcriptional regulator [Lacunisphaera sp.]
MNNEPNIQRSPGGELRARILGAARERFLRFGFAKTSMQEIATACNMSAANLYRFYKGKLAIGLAVALQEQASVLAICDHAVSAAGPETAERLIALFQATIEESRRNLKKAPLLFELDMIVAREEQELRRGFLREVEKRILAILSEGIDANAFESAAIKLQSRMIMMASAPFVLPWMLLNEPFGNPQSMVEPLIRSLISGLMGEVSVHGDSTLTGPPATPATSRAPRRTRPA